MDRTPGAGRPLRRVLVANRGEIAVRVIRACHLHRRLLGVPDIRSGRYHTAWLEEFLA